MRIFNIIKYCKITCTDQVVFFGSQTVALPTLQTLAPKYSNLSVVTHYTPQNVKLKNQVEIFCKENNINYKTPITYHGHQFKDKRIQQWKKFNQQLNSPHLGIICSYGFMIPGFVINKFKQGIMVIHPSLLPKYRGGAPIFHAIANGDTQSGVSYIHAVSKKCDQGSILHQVKCPLNIQWSYLQTEIQLAKYASNNIEYVLENWQQLNPGQPQKDLQASLDPQLLFAPIIRTKKIDLNMNASKVFHWGRALSNPRVLFNGKQIIIRFLNQYAEDDKNLQVGQLQHRGKKLYVKCKDKLIRLKSWQIPDRKQFKIGSFIDQFIKNSTQPKKLRFL